MKIIFQLQMKKITKYSVFEMKKVSITSITLTI
jgi:hypothetical protein